MSLLPGTESADSAVEGVRFRVTRAGTAKTATSTSAGRSAGTSAGAPAALLLHGVPQTGAMWRGLLPELANDRLVVAPDLKGLGASEVVGPYDTATLVRELAALVLHEVDGRVDVVGHDWGGYLAIALAAERPDLVRRLVVVSAPYRRIGLLHAWHLPLFALPMLPEVAFALGGRELVRRMLRYCWRAPGELDREVLEHYATAYADPARVQAMLAYYRAALRGRLAAAIGQRQPGPSPAQPTPARPSPERALVLWGALDPVLPLAIGESVMRDLGPGAQFVTLPGVGHLPLEEAPHVAVPVIADFLRAA